MASLNGRHFSGLKIAAVFIFAGGALIMLSFAITGISRHSLHQRSSSASPQRVLVQVQQNSGLPSLENWHEFVSSGQSAVRLQNSTERTILTALTTCQHRADGVRFRIHIAGFDDGYTEDLESIKIDTPDDWLSQKGFFRKSETVGGVLNWYRDGDLTNISAARWAYVETYWNEILIDKQSRRETKRNLMPERSWSEFSLGGDKIRGLTLNDIREVAVGKFSHISNIAFPWLYAEFPRFQELASPSSIFSAKIDKQNYVIVLWTSDLKGDSSSISSHLSIALVLDDVPHFSIRRLLVYDQSTLWLICTYDDFDDGQRGEFPRNIKISRYKSVANSVCASENLSIRAEVIQAGRSN